MKKKNIILISIVFITVVVCILAAVIGFGLNDEKKDDDKDTVNLSQNISDDKKEDSKEETKETTKDKEDEKETEKESEEETDQLIVEETTEKASEEMTTEKASEEETTSEEAVEEETTEMVTTKPFDRMSYEYMMIDGESVYAEFNEKLMELYDSINQIRSDVGVPKLTFDTMVSYIACARASQIAFEKTIENNQNLKYYDLMQKSGIQFSKAVENTAAGYEDATELVLGDGTSWKTSTKHYENMISDKYTKVGVGVDYSETMGYVWVAIFLN